MDRLHHAAISVCDVRPADARLHSDSVANFPLSRHEFLTLSNAASAPSVRLPASQGICLDIEVREHAETKHKAESTDHAADDEDDRLSFPAGLGFRSHSGSGLGGGVRLVPSRVRTWVMRDKNPVPHEPLLEWAGVQIGNVPATPRAGSHAASSPSRLQWRAQQYAVRCGSEELASDSSFAVRWRLRNNSLAVDDDRTSAHLSANLGAVLNVRKALAPPPAPPAASKPGKPMGLPAPPGSSSCLADLVAVSCTIGYDTPSFEWVSPAASSSTASNAASPVLRRRAHQVRSQLFAANDGMLIGGNVLYSHHARSAAAAGSSIPALLPPSSSFASFVSSLPRVSLGPSSAGLEFAWIQSLKDFTLGIGLQQKFRWVAAPTAAAAASEAAVSASGSLPPTAASRESATAAVSAVPLSTVSLSFQALGHIALSLHAPLTPRLSVSSLAHVQLTNLDSRLQSGVRYHLNDRHVVGVAADTAGGVQCVIARGPSAGRRQPHSSSVLSWLSRHVSLELRAQAFPLWPALMPRWNQQRDGVMGADYSPAKMMRNQQQQLQIGGSMEINF